MMKRSGVTATTCTLLLVVILLSSCYRTFTFRTGRFCSQALRRISILHSKTEDSFDEFKKMGQNKESSYGILPSGPDSASQIETSRNTYLEDKQVTENAIKYFTIVDNIVPHEMMRRFTSSAPRNVQEAAKSTIMNLLGTMPNYALDASLITTNKKLANLLYQMQITGYMFKNAEYQMSFTKLLKGLPRLSKPVDVQTGNFSFAPATADVEYDGKATVRDKDGNSMEVDVQDITTALSQEVEELRAELALIRSERENELKGDMLTYIQALPQKDLLKLTSGMSEDVVQSIELLVGAVMEKIGVPSSPPSSSSSSSPPSSSSSSSLASLAAGDDSKEMIMQQSVSQLAQLCMWQMVVGYKLRELEALDKGANLS